LFAALKKLFVINQVTILTYNLMGQTGEREKDKKRFRIDFIQAIKILGPCTIKLFMAVINSVL